MKINNRLAGCLLGSLLAVGLGGCEQEPPHEIVSPPNTNPFPSTYQAFPSENLLISNATVLTGTGSKLESADVWIQNGTIKAVGQGINVPSDVRMVDAQGKWVTPGIIDVHSHLGVYPDPGLESNQDGNEMTSPNTAEVWSEHSIWPQDPGFRLALAGGVTSMQILPGSANLFGGRTVTIKNVPSRTIQGMKFPEAPYGLKMACGENPKRVYGGQGTAPSTRMGNVAGYRAAWIAAEDYRRKWDDYFEGLEAGESLEAPERNLQLETLAEVLRGNILIHNHCYRAEEMAVMLDIAKEFGYTITAFHHAVEAYKVADLLAENNVCGALWADWWGFKHEAYDMVPENIALVDKAGGCAIVHSDSSNGIQRLNQEAAKAMAAGIRAGMNIAPEHAITWLTANAAKALGVADKTGTLEPGKMADLVIWSGNPFSVYTLAEKVFIDGALVYDRSGSVQSYSDFDLGIIDAQEVRP